MPEKPKSDPEVPEKSEPAVKLEAWLSVFSEVLKEESWLTGLKKVSTSKKALLALSGLVGTVASWLGAVWLVEDTDSQVMISSVALGTLGLVSSVYLYSQSKSDGAAGKETEVAKLKEQIKLELLKQVHKE